MNKETIKIVAGVAAALVATGSSVREIRRARREGREERAQIQKDAVLDMKAIVLGSAVVQERIQNGEIRSLEQLVDAHNTEIAFQKIAVREI